MQPRDARASAASGMMVASPNPECARMQGLPKEALEQVASYFQVLSDPTRLSLLNLLREGEHNVGDLAQLAGTTSANVSRHLAQLMRHGLVAREGRGTSVYYRIADASVYRLCDLVCGSLARRLDQAADARALFAAAPGAAEPAGRRRAARAPRRG